MGLRPEDFWRMTPVEFLHMQRNYEKKLLRHRNELIFLAWHMAAFVRVERLPSLESLISEEKEGPREQTPEEQLQVVKMLNALLGGEVVEQ